MQNEVTYRCNSCFFNQSIFTGACILLYLTCSQLILPSTQNLLSEASPFKPCSIFSYVLNWFSLPVAFYCLSEIWLPDLWFFACFCKVWSKINLFWKLFVSIGRVIFEYETRASFEWLNIKISYLLIDLKQKQLHRFKTLFASPASVVCVGSPDSCFSNRTVRENSNSII